MRRHSGKLFVVLAGTLAVRIAVAGGPLTIDTSGEPMTWGTATAIQYRTDLGPLSTEVTNAEARARVADMFGVWQDVASASISYNRAGDIQDVGAFTDGDVSTAEEFDAVEGACGNGDQSPIVYDVDGSLFEDLGEDPSVIGFAGPCAFNGSGQFVSGIAVMNGIYQDGIDNDDNFELSEAEFDAAFVHEFGHFSGLDHSQINVQCQSGCGVDNLAGLPTMFPFLLHVSQGSLATDDIAWISKLYPAGGAGGFAATHGTITGTVYFSDGESHAQLVNVIARQVNNPVTVVDESRTTAASGVSGNRFRVFHGNPINEPNPEPAGPFRSQDPAHIGFFEIPVPAGSYRIEVESIDPGFTEGSSVGGEIVIPMPGTAPPPIGPVTVTAGTTLPGNDIVLIGTPPRFDQFEGPE
ncbi:MAG TPA: hypothetical protein VNO53_08315 [Steroidobacteraceae bacterium]|nr:hypothetical protein [Steroidobacteraceae bacterium]